jgi:hypothetical protein
MAIEPYNIMIVRARTWQLYNVLLRPEPINFVMQGNEMTTSVEFILRIIFAELFHY